MDAFVGDKVDASLAELLQGYRASTIKLHKVKGPTLYEKATENSTQLFQAVALLGALFFQWFRKNKEQGTALREETAQPGAEGPSAPESSGVADPHKED